MEKDLNQRIVQLLTEVVDRTREIDAKNEGQSLIDIDLIMGDLRELYKEFELLRQQIIVSPVRPITPKGNLPIAEADTGEQMSIPQPQAIPTAAAHSEPMPEQPAVRVEYTATAIIPNDATVEIPVAKPTPFEPKVHEPDVAPIGIHQSISPGTQEPGEFFIVPPKTPVVVPAQQAENLKPTPPQEPPRIKSEQPAVSQFTKEDNSLHRRLAAQREDKSLSMRLQMTPVSNIKDAIGINEKFLFINELFGGNLQQYNEATQRLNHFSNLDEAFAYLNTLGISLQWDESHSADTIEKLAGIVMRRYMSK